MAATLIPIDYQKYAKKTGVRKGRIFYSNIVQSWVIENVDSRIDTDNNFSMEVHEIKPPYKVGDKVMGCTVTKVIIENRQWKIYFE